MSAQRSWHSYVCRTRRDGRRPGGLGWRTAHSTDSRAVPPNRISRGVPMPEAVIVSAARTPIGRAFKGSLKDMRPDDLAAFAIQAALDKVPGLDPTLIDDLYLGCGLPSRESGFNSAEL